MGSPMTLPCAETGPEEAPPGDGRISFRIRVGVTGHIDLQPSDALKEILRCQIERIQDELFPELGTSSTPVRLAVVSQLAEGADRLLPEEMMRHAASRDQTAHLEVILPMAQERYVERQHFHARSREEFNEWMRRATWVSEPSPDAALSDQEAYDAAARRLVRRCDVLVAIWRGEESGGKGGTAETLLHAAWCGKPCIWIRPGDHPGVTHNLDARSNAGFCHSVSCRAALPDARVPGNLEHVSDVLAPLREAYAGLGELNRASLPSDFERHVAHQLRDDPGRAWVAAPLLRASVLAKRNHRLFRYLAIGISVLVVLAAVVLGLSVSFLSESNLAWAEPAFLAAAALAFVVVHRGGFHRRWLSYRVLAERLRSAYYVAPTGGDFRRTAGLQGVYVERHSEDWVLRAFVEVWNRRPQRHSPGPEPDQDELADLRWRLAEQWLGEQIRFYRARAHKDQRMDRRLRYLAIAAFALALLFAVFHALGIWHNPSVLLSITLPALGGSLGVIVTVAQYRALASRYERMASELVVRQAAIQTATSLAGLEAASMDAARIIAQETGDWFGAMWFLDIEHL
jgi:hypothetical protein